MAFRQEPLFGHGPYLVGPSEVSITAEELGAEVLRDLTDDAWLNKQISITTGWAKYLEGKDEGTELAYWRAQARTPRVMSDNYVYVGWSQWWASYITGISQGDPNPDNAQGHKNLGVFYEVRADNSRGPVPKNGGLGKAKRYGLTAPDISVDTRRAIREDPNTIYAESPEQKAASDSKAAAKAAAKQKEDNEEAPCATLLECAEKGITPQLGLLEDDILYNLSLLCKNVLEPVKKKYPAIVIASGFRQVNTGIGQHERGQAVDIIIPSAADTLLYEVADFIVKTLQFDQVILNFSVRRDPWIHVSFSSTGLRGEALTRDFDDTFHSGLWLIEGHPAVVEDFKWKKQQEYLAKVDAELIIIAARQKKLNPVITIDPPNDNTMGPAGGDPVRGGAGIPDESMGNHFSIVQSVFENGVDWDLSDETEDAEFGSGKFVEAVVHAMPAEWGHLLKNSGQIQHNGHGIDVMMYKSPTPLNNGNYFQIVDFIVNSGSPAAHIGWMFVEAPWGSSPNDPPQGGWSKTP